jgi:hypothetical protein
MLVAWSDHCREIKSAEGFKFYINGELQYDQDTLQILPQKRDRSLKAYHGRMAKMFPDYCLVCDELLQASEVHWPSLHKLTTELFEHIGFPNRFAELGLYLGNYRKTPFGVHVDGCGVFSFPVLGQKKFRLWTSAFAKKNPDLVHAHDYSKFKKYSQVLSVGPGDMAYWPSSAWHIAESDGSFSVTWSLGVWVDRTHQENVQTAVARLVRDRVGAAGQHTTLKRTCPDGNGRVTQLPAIYEASLNALARISENDLHDSLMKQWLELSSLEGFKNSPLTVAKKLTLQSQIQIRPSRKILWSPLKSEGNLLFAFQGTLLEIEHCKEFLALIQDLNMGTVCRVGDYLRGPARYAMLKSLRLLARAFI